MKSYILAVAAVLSIGALIVASERSNGPQSNDSLEARIAALEMKSATHRLVVKSPNGKRSVEIVATDEVAGIWVRGNERREGAATIYVSDLEGGVIGTYAPGGLSEPMSLALCNRNPGSIQYRSEKGDRVGFFDLSKGK